MQDSRSVTNELIDFVWYLCDVHSILLNSLWLKGLCISSGSLLLQ